MPAWPSSAPAPLRRIVGATVLSVAAWPSAAARSIKFALPSFPFAGTYPAAIISSISIEGGGAVRDKRYTRPPTLGSTARAHLLLRTWCNRCRHWVGRPRRPGRALRCRSAGAGMAPAPRLSAMRQPRGRFGRRPQTPRLDQVAIKPTASITTSTGSGSSRQSTDHSTER